MISIVLTTESPSASVNATSNAMLTGSPITGLLDREFAYRELAVSGGVTTRIGNLDTIVAGTRPGEDAVMPPATR